MLLRRRRRENDGAGVYVGGIAPPPPSGWVNEYSLLFDGVNEVATGSFAMTGSQAETGLPIGATGSFTWSMWMYGSGTAPNTWLGTSANETFLSIGNQGAGIGSRFLQQSFKTRDGASTTLEWFFYEASPDGTNTTVRFNSPTVFAWHHFLLSFNGFGATNNDKIKVYVDGVQQSPTFIGTLPGALLSSSLPLCIGGAPTARYASVAIDELCLYNTNLTQSHATALYNAGVPVDPTTVTGSANLVHYWRMGDGDTFPVIQDQINFPGITNMPLTMVNAEASDITGSVAPAGTITW